MILQFRIFLAIEGSAVSILWLGPGGTAQLTINDFDSAYLRSVSGDKLLKKQPLGWIFTIYSYLHYTL